MVRYFAQHPEKLYQLTPRKFEELVAEIMADMGYAIQLTKNSADGGVDIFATEKTNVGESLIIVDCKKYVPKNHVGVSVVRSLYGIAEQMKATMGMIATTSFFTRPALEFQETIRNRMSLKDFNDIVVWLSRYRAR